MNAKRKVILISTGGTIEKVYDETDGSLSNRGSVIRRRVLRKLRLPYTDIEVRPIMSKDSLHMTEDDRSKINEAVLAALETGCPVIVLHGTDTLDKTVAYMSEHNEVIKGTVVFTGAMKPLGFEDSDALQNVTEALVCAQILGPGIYSVFHNRVFMASNLRKNYDNMTFESYD